MTTPTFIKCRNVRLKCILIFFIALLGSVRQSFGQSYFNSDTTLVSGTYTVSGWASGVTITIPAGDTVTINCSYGNGNLLINGILNLSSTSFGMAGSLTLGPGASCTTAGPAQFQGARTYGTGSVMTVNGTMTVADVPVMMNAKSEAIIHGDYTSNISSTGTSNILVQDSAEIIADGVITLNGSHLLLDTGSLVKSGGNMNFNNGNSTLDGIMQCGGTLKFSTPNITMNCADITTVNLDNEAESGTLSGTGLVTVTGTFTGNGNPLTNSTGIVLNAATIGAGGNPGSATIGTTSPCTQALPITLSTFTAQVHASAVTLIWTTNSELNNKGFAVERSANGKDYTQIAFVDSKAPNGTGSSPLNYVYTDNTPYQGYNYYRLKQEDINGISAYYVLKQPVDLTNSAALGVYPSPVINMLNVTGAGNNATYRIMDISGKVLLTSAANSINVSSLAPGVYFVQVTEEDKTRKTIKFIKE